MGIKSQWIWAAAASLCLAMAADEDVAALPEGQGKAVVAAVCLECHGAATFRKKRVDAGEWTEVVGDMVDRGAKAGAPEQAAIVAYLTQHFGPDSKVEMNSAPLVELRAVLNLTSAEAQAIVTYRKGNGAFKQWRDLLKVPGLDPQKVEDRQDKMLF